MPDGIFGYSCLGISLTITCPLQCAHCITNSAPTVRDEMSTEEAIGYLHDARGAIDHVSFTGGEPFLNPERLRTVVAEASKLGFVPSVMTSGFWGASKPAARRRLVELQDRGLQMLGVSLDRYHLEFIEETRCVNVAEVCDELGIELAVRVISAPGDTYGEHAKEILAHTTTAVHVNAMVKLGRADQFGEDQFNTCAHLPRDTCETVTAADVVPGGVTYACCGPGLYMHMTNPLVLGNAQEEPLGEILARGLQNPFMKVINTRGPIGLMEDLESRGLDHLVPRRKRYTDVCQLCLDICNRPAAVEALEEMYAEPDVAREQNALQFLKLVEDRRVVDRAIEAAERA